MSQKSMQTDEKSGLDMESILIKKKFRNKQNGEKKRGRGWGVKTELKSLTKKKLMEAFL